jgi:hypothetical protein
MVDAAWWDANVVFSEQKLLHANCELIELIYLSTAFNSGLVNELGGCELGW